MRVCACAYVPCVCIVTCSFQCASCLACVHMCLLTVLVKLSAVATAIVVIVLLAQGGGGCAVSSLDLQPQMKTGDDIFTFVEVSWDGMESLSL